MSAFAPSGSPASMAALACSQSGVSIRAISASLSIRSATATSSLEPRPLLAGKAEHALGDDVALDLAGTAGDRPAERPHPLCHPCTLAPHLRAEVTALEAGRAERGRAELEAALHRLAAEQLQERVLGRRLAGHELGEAAVAHAEDRPCVDRDPRDLIAVHGVVADPTAADGGLLAERDQC